MPKMNLFFIPIPEQIKAFLLVFFKNTIKVDTKNSLRTRIALHLINFLPDWVKFK